MKELYAYFLTLKTFALWYRVTEVLLLQILRLNQSIYSLQNFLREIILAHIFIFNYYFSSGSLFSQIGKNYCANIIVCQRLEIITYYSTVRA